MFYYWTKVDYKNYESYNFGFKIIFILGEGAMSVYYFLQCFFVCKYEDNLLLMCLAFGSLRVHEFVCLCVFGTCLTLCSQICSWHTCMTSALANTGNLILQCKRCFLLSYTVCETYQILFEINLV